MKDEGDTGWGLVKHILYPVRPPLRTLSKTNHQRLTNLIQLDWNFLDLLNETIYLFETLNIMAGLMSAFTNSLQKNFFKFKFLEFCFQNTQ